MLTEERAQWITLDDPEAMFDDESGYVPPAIRLQELWNDLPDPTKCSDREPLPTEFRYWSQPRQTWLQSTFEAWQGNYPNAGLETRCVVNWILFGQKDRETRCSVLHWAQLHRAVYGVPPSNRRFNAHALLKKVQAELGGPEVFDFTEEYLIQAGKARICKWLRLPQPLMEALLIEVRTSIRQGERVYVRTGQAVTTKKEKQRWEEERQAMLVEVQALTPNQQYILDYLNNVPPSYLRKVYEQNYEAARAAALGIEDEARCFTALAALETLMETPVLVWSPSEEGNTVRVFAQGISPTSLKREVREVLFQGLLSVDLRNSQLAIAVRDWQMEKLLNFLNTGQSLWQELVKCMGVEVTGKNLARYKPAIKEALYGAVYGEGQEKTRTKLMYAEIVIQEKEIDNLLSSWVFKELYKARSENKNLILEHGGVEIEGEWYPVEWDANGKSKTPIHKLQARRNQAIEFGIMARLLKSFEGHESEIRCLYWLHDGIYCWTKNVQTEKAWRRQIDATVRAMAGEMQIPLSVEFSGGKGGI